MKLKSNLSPGTIPAQQRSGAGPKLTLPAGCSRGPLRSGVIILSAHPILRGDKSYLRALRQAEMAAWNRIIKLPEQFG